MKEIIDIHPKLCYTIFKVVRQILAVLRVLQSYGSEGSQTVLMCETPDL
jgi:hypothetical protein